ncbi:MAG TPA: acetyl-CoA carboxylase, carboxyltransferase subunit beta [Planctomycetota bacterium]|nr:acetyl-CoA carboxylase, carboxyltransferase subunit beta [Planctomycetota bacterium]
MPRPDPKSIERTQQELGPRPASEPASPASNAASDRAEKQKREQADMPQPVVDRPAAKTKESEAKPAETSLSETRFARLRKKKDMPEGLWLKCERCGQMIYRKELEEKGRVCPACDFHFTLPGRERIAMVLDPGSWQERFPDLHTIDRLKFHDQIPYLDKVKKAETRTGQAEALLCGLGSIEGRPIVLAVLDFSFLGGSMGEVVGEKIALAAELAGEKKVPLVIFTSSGGARMHEGVLSLMQMAKTCSALAGFKDKGGFSICVMSHPTTGGVTASFASVCDLTLAEPGALIGFAGPRVIATTLKQELPAGFQRAEFLLSKGQIDLIVRRSEVRPLLARLLDYGRGPRVKGARAPRP